MHNKPITLIKLGGSIITNKDIPLSLRSETLSRLVGEITRAKLEQPDKLLIVGHGQGSFAHVPASKYKTMDGFVNGESRLGMAIVLDSAAQLNRIVVHEFLKHDIPAVSFLPSQSLVTDGRKAKSFFRDVFMEYLEKGLFPVTCGDVIADSTQGCTIWSTEDVLSYFTQHFTEAGWPVEKVIHVTEVAGVLNQNLTLVEQLTPHNWPEVQQAITTTKGFDVTGGMGKKISESLRLAENGVPSYILSGLVENNLYNALTNRPWSGTTITTGTHAN